jgi:hypothetical protein
VSGNPTDILAVEIDPTQRLADIDRKNNKLELAGGLKPYSDPTK